MIPNNNLSVLPWYTSIDQQNARKWWVYGRVFPLFTPAGYLLPFQVIREHRREIEEIYVWSQDSFFEGYIAVDGALHDDSQGFYVFGYDNSSYNYPAVKFNGIGHPQTGGILAVAYDAMGGNVLGTFNPDFEDTFTGIWDLPAGTKYIYVQHDGDLDEPVMGVEYSSNPLPIQSFEIYTEKGVLVQTFNPDDIGIQIVGLTTSDSDVIVFPGQVPITPSMNNGQYYAVMSDGIETWYSEVFTVVNDIAPYLKIEWWDNENFVMDAGTIIYQSPSFRNVLYLNAEIAKPEYLFEEEGETRDGYFFPVKMISEKRYRFKFFAAEYLLDVMRFIRMADFAQITANGQVYSLDTFLITPEWEENGDVASVEAQFDTATVAKKIGVGYIKTQRGDFNDDFNNDYNI